MSLRLVEIRYKATGESFLALQGQTDEEAHEMNRNDLVLRDQMAARIFGKRVPK